MASKTSLSKEDWIQAGFRALTAGGPQAVKVEKIARTLKVSKGSFYWHFKNADSLKHAMLNHWVEFGTNEIIVSVETGYLLPIKKFLALGTRITGDRDVEYGGILAEAAIRDWARFDSDVSKVVRKVNKTRLKYIAKLFSEMGMSEEKSEVNAAITYSAMIGLEFLEHQGLSKMQTNMQSLMDILIEENR